MLPKHLRFHSKNDIDMVFAARRSCATSHFKVFFTFPSSLTGSSQAATPKYAVMVNKKFGSAVERNKIRRQIYALLRKEGMAMLPNNTRAIFSSYSSLKSLSSVELREAFLEVVTKIKKAA